ncbi:PREDICTED: SET and MYND domain-containing protein 5 [Rhagoletis zephyria]|uniref:SET and MYND domain-containing protein 5 n=1 Tax=Rhagoletis zephyria TaxID=28612 RepID=UPI000811A388|nr:PREDICTED: SET and MYND domain-containing protein 5 [Rhagoletis zephyria]XP_036331404.1 SET and MYND domain-containing protein 5 [Rhagoletis pomonella]
MYSFEIREIPGKGRAMISTKPFAVGETIFEEEPFVSRQFSWNAAYGYAACDHCMRPLETVTENVRRLANNKALVVPLIEHDPTKPWLQQFTKCERCKVRYCSEDCRIEALNKYHRVACLGAFHSDDTHPINVLNEIWKKMHYPPETGTIMLIVRLMAMYKQSNNKQQFLESLQSFQSVIVNAEKQIYHKMLGANFEQQMEQLFLAFCRSFADEEFAAFTTADAFKALMGMIGTNSQGIATSTLAEWVKKVSDLPLPEEDKVKLDEYIDDIYNKVGEFAGEFLNTEGAGLYLLQSKINHSCMPNAQSTFPYSNDIVVLKAVAPIQTGEEICISYLDECQLERSRHSRQKILKENYIFVCQCPKCQLQATDPDETSEDEEDDYEMDMDDDAEMSD